MIIAVDLDDTLCWRPKEFEYEGIEKYKRCVPFLDRIKRVNQLYDEGNTIIVYTSRGMTSLEGDLQKIEQELRPITEESLKEWKLKYHKLVFGKIHFDLLIDDKARDLTYFV